MSATGRGRERRADDFYATPGWVTRAILPELLFPETVLDPCCGDGAILDEMDDDSHCYGIDIDPNRAGKSREKYVVATADALACGWMEADLIITNPPYPLAMEFLQKALTSGAKEVAFLLRLNFLGSQRRAQFHKEHPCDVYVLPKRPSFAHGGTDACEYAWFVWREGRGNRWFILDV